MVINVEDRVEIDSSEILNGIGKILAKKVLGFLSGEEEYAYLKKRREECNQRGKHKKSVQVKYPIYLFDDIPLHEISIPMFCKYCQTFYHRRLTSEEIKQYHQRREKFQEKLHEPFTI